MSVTSQTGSSDRIDHLLRTPQPVISFEYFPPRSDEAQEQLWQAIADLQRIHPSYVSVTYGAGGSTRERTVRLTARIKRDTRVEAMAHLTCVGSSRTELADILGEYERSGIKNLLALRGDPAGGLQAPWTSHPEGFDHSDELVAFIREQGDFTVGVAAFPDGHPESADHAQDVAVLRRKAQMGASFAITQMVTDVDAYLRLRDDVALGDDFPIVPGMMPVTSLAQLKRMSELNGQPLAEEVVRRLEEVADDPQEVRRVGIDICVEHSQRLLEQGAPGLHFITMNRSRATTLVHDRLVDLGVIPGPEGREES